MLLDEVLPEHEFRERHATTVAAPPERVLEAVRQVTPADISWLRMLIWLRSLPSRVAGRAVPTMDPHRPLLDQMHLAGFVPLADRSGEEIVMGEVAQAWRAVPDPSPDVRDAREFVAFDERGYTKSAVSFLVEDVGGRTRLTTETRVHATDPVSRKRFARYWRAIWIESGVIRRGWLSAAKRRAESGGEIPGREEEG